ncbi:MAG: hypothetical protein BroJett018_27980 [Chloroflexota bacterium]|nr:type II toxin-antitoxin system HicA family toxin [Chloroflexota bacterium]NOG63762.1 type II toxin-antitoxin system HicA family toxin [Chloroflexota bacterium]GIK65004.1 MAG: hypothetical protein BroJett018_27980 [Chloroflexota bacterium]
MSKREKLRRKLRNNPKDATIQEVETLLSRFGFKLERISGSHHVFRFSDDEQIQVRSISVPLHGRKVKTVYVQQVIELLDELFPGELSNDVDGEETDE